MSPGYADFPPDMGDICPTCCGSGEGMHDGSRCAQCLGWGAIPLDEDQEDNDQ